VNSLEENFSKIQNANSTALAISIDSPYANKAWADMIGVKNTPLLSDFWPHGHVAAQYGVFRDKDGIAERANVVLDENHSIIFHKIYALEEQPDMSEVYNLL
jgi:peroxiredoxin